MNEIVYSIVRKCVEEPESIELKGGGTDIYIKGELILCISVCQGFLHNFRYRLNDKDCRRILRAVEHAAAVRLRNM
ncbi:hypothetical protein NVP1121O_012 [Vibrio phage 1.121.O._10N.286.46.C4]|nr:hypothetical protein NVP1121O_012 [Vibrio phage 1.121.O._10N.286.46.C4]